MKNFVLFAMLLLTFASWAQHNKKDRKKEIQAQKVAFLTTELNLTTEEAEKFWPIYNQYEAEMEQNRRAHHQIIKKLKDFENLTDEEAYSYSEQLMKLDDKRNSIRKTYLVKFAQVLGKKKGAKVFYAEEKFKRELLRKIRKQGPPPNDHPPVKP